ncbi:hypothetical protein VVD49_03105 [Uliginosibacterium sp. H3]|uniref:Cupin domain-containing protein n=1 Tax=Uliginosibacterium silvisoli TaxID=3114758 RepID=A0ABU6JYF1_9RHOO|nr:hypothetical protein [Uliginosibacterium sp. H3]
MTDSATPTFKQVILFTDVDGRAKFREEEIALTEGNPNSRLSAQLAASGVVLRESPAGFRSQMHCTGKPQWVFILSGAMEIGLADGSTRRFNAGEHFYSADTLPEGETFNPEHHGHWSREVAGEPLVTLFVKG